MQRENESEGDGFGNSSLADIISIFSSLQIVSYASVFAAAVLHTLVVDICAILFGRTAQRLLPCLRAFAGQFYQTTTRSRHRSRFERSMRGRHHEIIA
jgi:hypothetical protein